MNHCILLLTVLILSLLVLIKCILDIRMSFFGMAHFIISFMCIILIVGSLILIPFKVVVNRVDENYVTYENRNIFGFKNGDSIQVISNSSEKLGRTYYYYNSYIQLNKINNLDKDKMVSKTYYYIGKTTEGIYVQKNGKFYYVRDIGANENYYFFDPIKI